MNRYKTLAANTAVLAIGQFAAKFLVIIMMGFYQSMLGTTGYGEINNIIDIAVLLMSFASLSIGEGIIRFGLDKSYRKDQVFSIGLRVTVIGLLVSLIFIPLVSLLSDLMPDVQVLALLKQYAWITMLYVITGCLKSSVALFVRSAGYVRLYAVDGIFTTIMNILFNLLLLWAFNLGNIGYLLSVILADVCSICFLWFMADLKRYFLFWGLDKRLTKGMLKFSIPMIPTSVMWWITNVSSSFFVSEMISFEASGIYKAAYKLPSMIALISGIFSQAWNMSAITEKNSRTIANFYTNVFNIFQSFIYVLGAGLLLVIRPAIAIICAPEFHVSYIYTPFLIMSVVFTCFSTFMGSVYLASKQSVRSMVTSAIGAGLNILLCFLLVPVLQIQGAALAGFIGFLVIFIVRALDSRRIVFMDMKLPKMITNILLLFAMGMIVMFVTNDFAYYITLSLLFVIVVILNFQAGIKAVKMILHKGGRQV